MDRSIASEHQPVERLARREFHLFAGTSSGPRLVVVSTVRRFRSLARDIVKTDDSVLEIGCSTGATTRILAMTAAKVLAVDISRDFVQRTAQVLAHLEHVTVRHGDGRNLPPLARLMPRPDLVFVDIGGSAQADNATFVVRQCLLTFTPRALVVRNTELAAMMSLVERVEVPLSEDWPFAPIVRGDEARLQMLNLLALSRSVHTRTREYAVRRLVTFHDRPEVHQRLQELANDTQPRVRRIARSVLERVGLAAHLAEPRADAAELPDG